jgi:hypothetical protein
MADTLAYLGRGLIVPFRRDGKDDFAHGVGKEVVESSLTVILGTMCAGPTNDGEVPFNQKLGTLIKLLRHRNVNDPTTQDLATHYVADGILANEPRIKAKAVGFTPRADDNRVAIRLRYDLVSRDTTGINVVAQDVEQEFEA